MNVIIYGAGYVGTVTAGCLAKLGHQVWLIETAESKVNAVRQGRSPVLEPGLDELIAQGVTNGRIKAQTEAGPAMQTADLAMICVGTPSLLSGLIDTKALRRVFQSIAKAARLTRSESLPVVVRSTTLAPVIRSLR